MINMNDLPRNKRTKLLNCLGTIQVNEPVLSILEKLSNSKKTNDARRIGFKAIRTNSEILERKINRTLTNLSSSRLSSQGEKLWS